MPQVPISAQARKWDIGSNSETAIRSRSCITDPKEVRLFDDFDFVACFASCWRQELSRNPFAVQEHGDRVADASIAHVDGCAFDGADTPLKLECKHVGRKQQCENACC